VHEGEIEAVFWAIVEFIEQGGVCNPVLAPRGGALTDALREEGDGRDWELVWCGAACGGVGRLRG